jgi:hypothetical protein
LIPRPITDKNPVLAKRSSPQTFENTSFSPFKKNKILPFEERGLVMDKNCPKVPTLVDLMACHKPQPQARPYLDIQFMNNLNIQFKRRQEMQLICKNMLIRQALSNAAQANLLRKAEIPTNVKEERDNSTSGDKEDASTTFPHDDKSSPVISHSEVEYGKSEVGIHSPSNFQDEAGSVKDEFPTRDISQVDEPALCCVTKLHPDWDLLRILDFYCRGKVIEEPKNRTLRSKLPKAEDDAEPGKEIEGDFISEDEVISLMKDLNKKLESFLGFANLDQDKVYKILDKNGMDIKKTMSLIKKNSKFYKKYFQAEETS